MHSKDIIIVFLSIAVIVGYAFSFLLDSLTLCARYGASVTRRNAVGGYFSQVILLGSRLSVVLLMPASAMLVDMHTDWHSMMILFGMSAFASSVMLLIIYVKRSSVVSYFSGLAEKFISGDGSGGVVLTDAKKKRWAETNIQQSLFMLVFVVCFINSLGLSVPMIMAGFFVNWKTAISHTGSIVNAVSTIINTLYLEAVLARSFELHHDHSSTDHVISTFLLARAFSLLFTALLYAYVAINYIGGIG